MGGYVDGPNLLFQTPYNTSHPDIVFNPLRRQYQLSLNENFENSDLLPGKLPGTSLDNVGYLMNESGAVLQGPYLIGSQTGTQFNPKAAYNSVENSYMINWEDFRAHGDSLDEYGTLDVMTDIYGALLAADGTLLVNDITMCVDANGIDGDQRFNAIVYNSQTNQFLVSWTDTRDSLHNVGIMGRIVESDGTMPAEDFTLVDVSGAQMIGHTLYLPKDDKYFIAFERDRNNVDPFYFKDITAHLDIGAMWLDANGQPEADIIDICDGERNQRFVRFAHDIKDKSILLVWQDDFPGVSDSVEGHIMSAGGNIMGKLYKK